MLTRRPLSLRLDRGLRFLLLDRFADGLSLDLAAVEVNGEAIGARGDFDLADTINTFQ